jgi:uncharacterized membrane protein (DUF2068 family)
MNTQRPLSVIIAAILMALISLVGLPGPLLPGSEEVPAVVIYGGIVLGIVGLIAAVGLWMLKTTWGFWLTVVVSALNILSAAPGIAFASDAALQVFAAVGVLVPTLIIVLVVLPISRRAYTQRT